MHCLQLALMKHLMMQILPLTSVEEDLSQTSECCSDSFTYPTFNCLFFSFSFTLHRVHILSSCVASGIFPLCFCRILQVNKLSVLSFHYVIDFAAEAATFRQRLVCFVVLVCPACSEISLLAAGEGIAL